MSDRDPSARARAGALVTGEKLRTKPVELPSEAPRDEQTTRLLRELVAHLRDQRAVLREEWLRRITGARLLMAMSREEIYAEATSIFDQYVEALEAGAFEALQTYAQNLSERIIPRGVETHEVVGIVLLLRDVLARALFTKYHSDLDKLNQILDAYEPAANRIAITVAVGFVQERERVIREQQEAIRELSTPVLQVRERLLILPIIGLIDPQRARQLTEQLLRAIRRKPGPRGGHRHHGGARDGLQRGQPPGADGGGLPAVGSHLHRHRPFPGHRPDSGEHRGGPEQDEHGG